MYRRWNDPEVCRWCGADLPLAHKSQWCCPAHKQAHHRAYKKYVTRLSDRQKGPFMSKRRARSPSNAKTKRKEP